MAEIKIILYKDITIQTKKLGELKFPTLNHANILKAGQSIEKLPSDKEAFLWVLDALQLEPKKDRNSLASLSDVTLARIGKELLNKSKLIDRYEKAKRVKGNFFSKFTDIIKTLAEEKKKSQEQLIKQIYPHMKFLLPEKSEMERMASKLDSPFRKILEEEERRQAMIQLTGMGITSADRLAADFGKAAHNFIGDDFIKEKERLMKEAENTAKMLGPSMSMAESLKNQLAADQPFIDAIQAQIDASRKFAGEHQELFNAAEKMAPIELNFKDKLLELMPPFMKMPNWQAEAAVASGALAEISAIDEAVQKATGEFSHIMKISETIAADIKKLYGRMSPDEIHRYQEIWQPVNFPAFIENPLNTFDDYIVRGEEWGYFGEAEIDQARSIQSFLRQQMEKLPSLSKQTKVLCAMVALKFVDTLKDLGDRLENGALTEWSAAVAVLILSANVLVLYYQFMKEKPDEKK